MNVKLFKEVLKISLHDMFAGSKVINKSKSAKKIKPYGNLQHLILAVLPVLEKFIDLLSFFCDHLTL